MLYRNHDGLLNLNVCSYDIFKCDAHVILLVWQELKIARSWNTKSDCVCLVRLLGSFQLVNPNARYYVHCDFSHILESNTLFKNNNE
jgi:hypothetical protein